MNGLRSATNIAARCFHVGHLFLPLDSVSSAAEGGCSIVAPQAMGTPISLIVTSVASTVSVPLQDTIWTLMRSMAEKMVGMKKIAAFIDCYGIFRVIRME